MGTDYWPEKDGYISDGLVVGYCKAAGSITLHTAVKISASAASCLTVDEAGYQEGVGVALLSADTNDFIPVCFYGVVKMKADTAAAISVMQTVVSGTTAADITRMPVVADTADNNYAANNGTGTLHKLGMALQAGTTDADELLVLIGGAR